MGDQPQGLNDFFKYVIGVPPPEGDIPDMRELAWALEAFEGPAKAMAALMPQLSQAMQSAMQGSAAQAFADQLSVGLVEVLEQSADRARGLYEMTLNAAAEVESTWVMFAMMLAIFWMIVYQLVSYLGPTGTAFIPAVVSWVRWLVEAALIWLVQTLAELGLGALVPYLTDVGQLNNHLRTHIDRAKHITNVVTAFFSGTAVAAGRVAANSVTGYVGRQLHLGGKFVPGGMGVHGMGFRSFVLGNHIVHQSIGGVATAGLVMATYGGPFQWNIVTSQGLLEGVSGAHDTRHALDFAAIDAIASPLENLVATLVVPAHIPDPPAAIPAAAVAAGLATGADLDKRGGFDSGGGFEKGGGFDSGGMGGRFNSGAGFEKGGGFDSGGMGGGFAGGGMGGGFDSGSVPASMMSGSPPRPVVEDEPAMTVAEQLARLASAPPAKVQALIDGVPPRLSVGQAVRIADVMGMAPPGD
ncbi:MAG TPA: hypothetical protein VGQ99_07770, partial [Tepidisphaeraceae bacterium]|nr:hypothetical protein [Tepidisphaeraceae bacterium]